MTYRVTLDVPATGITRGIPYVTSDEANTTIVISTTSGYAESWSGVRIDHAPEPGTSGTASMGIYKQSDDSLIAETLTTGTIYLYYPNNAEYSNANLSTNQGICEWDTYYYMTVTPNTPTERRERIALRKITTSTSLM